MISKSGVDMTFITDDELWEELRNRSDAAIYAFVRHDRIKLESSGMNYKGGKFIALGLAEALANQLKEIISSGYSNHDEINDDGGTQDAA